MKEGALFKIHTYKLTSRKVCKGPSVFLFTFLFVLVFKYSSGQEATALVGVIKNSKNNLGIPYASIAIEKTTLGAISNEQGAFKIIVPREYRHGRLFISSIGYETKYLPLADSLFLRPVEIEVEENALILSEVSVTAKGETPLEVFKEAVKVTKEKSYSPAILHTYYREFLKINTKYTEYADALIDYYLPTADTWQSRSGIEIKVNESRVKSFPVRVDSGLGMNPRQLINLKILPGYCNPDRILRYFTKHGAEENYSFSISEDASRGIYTITVVPKPGIKKKLYAGKIYIDKASMILTKADIEIPASHLMYTEENILLIRMRVEKLHLQIHYQVTNDKCFIKHIRADLSLRTYNKKKTNVVHSFVSEFVTNQIDFDKVIHFKKEDVFKKNSLQKGKTLFTNEFWAKQSGLVATPEEEAILRNLDQNH
jgi:hypothetical protein